MELFIQILLLLAGLVLVVGGAEALVDGASSLARRWGVSEFVIGLTVVALGTSAPEMVVSFLGAIQGKAGISIGNIVGSNIFNTAFILGLSAVVSPLIITRTNVRRDIPINLFVTLLLIVVGMKGTIFGHGLEDSISRLWGVIFLVLFAGYMYMSFRFDKDNLQASSGEEGGEEKPKALWLSAILVLGGLGALIFGGRLFVGGAERIAGMAGLSDKFIAITILAAGTSLPELATSVVAAAKGKGQLALGNILGSNTFNILLILGGSAVINDLDFSGIDWFDLGALFLSSFIVLLGVFSFRKGMLDRVEGSVLVLLQIAYMTWLCLNI